MFCLHQLSYQLKDKVLLKTIDCIFETGKHYSIIGPNGAGKSTLLQLLSGQKKTSSGTVSYQNVNIAALSEKEMALQRAYLHQQPGTAFDFSVEEIILIGRYPHINFSPSKRDLQIVNEVLDILEIRHLKHRNSASLSGGELQRVHFARTLAQLWPSENDKHPKLLLLDEPVNNLDPKHQHILLQIALHFAEVHQFTVVSVLHDLNLSLQYSHFLLALKEGKLLAQGPVKNTLTEKLIQSLFDVEAQIIEHKHQPFVVYTPTFNSSSIVNKSHYEPAHL